MDLRQSLEYRVTLNLTEVDQNWLKSGKPSVDIMYEVLLKSGPDGGEYLDRGLLGYDDV